MKPNSLSLAALQASRAISALALAGGIGVLISGAYAATPVSGLPVGLTTTQSAACAVLLGAASLLTTLRARAAKVIGQVAALLACALALQPAITAALASSFASLPPLPEHPLAQWLLDPAAMPAATSLMFAVTALSLFCTPLRRPGATHVFAAVAGFGLLAVATSLMGFALQSSSLASLGLAQVPAPLNTVTAGLLLMAALAQRGDAGWLSALLSPSAAGSSARGIIVWTVLAPLALALLALAGERLGYYDLRFAFALLASTMCCILTALVLWNAARVERAHAHAESARDAMQLLADRLRLARTATGIGIWEWLPASREWRSIDGGERLDPSANEYLEAGLARSLRDGRAEFEFPLVRASHGEHPPGENSPDGNPRLQRWMFAKCWKEVRGGDAVIVGISLDITERRHAALALEVSETRLQLAARALPGFVYDWNRASGKVLRTSGVEQMLGYQEAEVSPAGRWWDELIHVDDAPLASPARVTRAAGPGSELDSIASEYRVRHRDGRYVWVWDHCVLVRDRSGQVTRVVGSVLDITERKEAEARLAASEHRFKAALLANTGMIWTFAPDGMAQGEQTSWSAFTGQRAEELQGMGWLDAIHPDDVDSTREAWRKALDSGQELITVHRVRRRDGVYRTFSVHAVTVTDERGHITEWVGSHTDITEQRELEAEREALLAAERAARHELIAASKVKDEFLATISHELRTPLNAILGWTTLLQRPRVDAATLRDGLKVIERNARAQTQLLGDLLDANQLMSGKLSLAFEPMDFNEVVRATLDSMRVSVAARKVRIEARLSGESLPVLGDPVRLQQVISNLLSNAIKFTPQDGLITVATDCGDDVACCEVRDSGEGISAEFLPHVFEKFRQADSGGARRFAGLGLGLAITRQLVESHGGSISAHSEGRGKGAAFRVRLPRLASAQIPAARMAQAGNDKPLAGLSILAVDDEADSREYLERLLAEQGADVVSVASGAEALAVLETGSERFNLLVSDIGMPDSTGYELIESVRQRLHVAPHVLPAVALTAFARQEDRVRALDKGFQKHLVKPVQVGRLIGAIRQLTGRQQPRAMRPRGTSDQRPDIRV